MPYVVSHNPEKCDGCFNCIKACALAHFGLANCQIFKVGEKFAYFACMQCKRPQCAEVCPTGAIRREEEIVILIPGLCVGCLNCVYACPWGVPKFNPRTGRVNKCDLCKDRVSQGQKPFCVEACPRQALILKEVKTPPKKIASKKEKPKEGA